MDITSSFRGHPILSLAEDVETICQPLKKFNIDFFIYAKAFPNNKMTFLTTSAPWSEDYIPNIYNSKFIEHHQFEQNIQSNSLISCEIFPNNPVYKVAKEKFGYHCGFIMPFSTSKYREVCYFATSSADLNMYNFFLQNVDMLDLFKLYFKEKAARLIATVEKNKLPGLLEYLTCKDKLTQKELLTLPPLVKDQLLLELSSSRVYLPKDPEERYLTKTEHQCILWLIKGKSAEEIGLITNISKRTVEVHISNVKEKFKCNKTTLLIYKLIEYGLLI